MERIVTKITRKLYFDVMRLADNVDLHELGNFYFLGDIIY